MNHLPLVLEGIHAMKKIQFLLLLPAQVTADFVANRSDQIIC